MLLIRLIVTLKPVHCMMWYVAISEKKCDELLKWVFDLRIDADKEMVFIWGWALFITIYGFLWWFLILAITKRHLILPYSLYTVNAVKTKLHPDYEVWNGIIIFTTSLIMFPRIVSRSKTVGRKSLNHLLIVINTCISSHNSWPRRVKQVEMCCVTVVCYLS